MFRAPPPVGQLPGPATSRYRCGVLRIRSSSVSPSRALRFAVKGAGLSIALITSSGCQNYRGQLARGQGYYEQNQYEAALAVWRNLEPDQHSLSRPEVVRYCYLRGMTDYRLGYKTDARYWLGLSQAALNRSQATDGEAVALQPDEIKRLDETLGELNAEVFGTTGEERDGEESLGDKCEWTSDCDSGFACQDGMCVQAEGPDAAPVDKSTQAPPASGTTPPPAEAP